MKSIAFVLQKLNEKQMISMEKPRGKLVEWCGDAPHQDGDQPTNQLLMRD